MFPAQDDLEEADDYERVDNFKREAMHPSKKPLKSDLRKKIRKNVYKTKAPELEETMESQLPGEVNSFSLKSMMNQGRLMQETWIWTSSQTRL